MNISSFLKEKINSNSLFYFMYLPCVTFIAISGLLLLCYPKAASDGVTKGISVCTETLIPTLFPFMLLSQLAVELKLFNVRSKISARFFESVFRLPLSTLPIIIFSFIGGFPLGAMLIKTAYEKGEISLSQGQRMMLFCVNPGPSFALSTIGYALYNSEKTGIIVYASSVISSLMIAFLSRFLCDDDDKILKTESCERRHVRFYNALSEAVNTSVKGIVNICVWVVIFSCFGELIGVLNLSEKTSDFVLMLSEVTNGVYCAARNYDLPIVCAVIGFSGFCLHMQILPAIIKLRLKYRFFLVARIITAAFNCIICYLLVDLFPQNALAAAIGEKAETISVASSVPLCICLLIFCGLFVAGEGLNRLYIKKNKREIKANKRELY